MIINNDNEVVKWHKGLKLFGSNENTYQNSYSLCTLITIICFFLSYFINIVVFNDKLSQCLFIQQLILTLFVFIYRYPTDTLVISGHIQLRLLKWIFMIVVLSVFMYLIRTQPEVCSSMIFSLVISVKLFNDLPFHFPQTITFCELIVLVNIMASGLLTYLGHFLQFFPISNEEIIVADQAVMWLVILALMLNKLELAKVSVLCFIILSVVFLIGFFLPMCLVALNQNAFTWLYEYIVNSKIRIYLLVYWLILFVSIGFIFILQQRLINASLLTHSSLSAMRKLFHLLICCVYIPGLMGDRYFLTLCSFGMLVLLCLLEMIRYYKISFIGEKIDYLSKLFVDNKEKESKLILSHIYLLIGLSFPIWMSNMDEHHISQYSGLLTIGIGDSCASLIGSHFGYHKWPGSKKSIEGTFGFIVSVLTAIFVIFKRNFTYINPYTNIQYIVIGTVLSAIVETICVDNDNLLLSIVIYPFLRLIK